MYVFIYVYISKIATYHPMLGFNSALFFVKCIKYEERIKMGEIVPKSTDKITKLNSQEIYIYKKNL